jgi:hypothetical protein
MSGLTSQRRRSPGRTGQPPPFFLLSLRPRLCGNPGRVGVLALLQTQVGLKQVVELIGVIKVGVVGEWVAYNGSFKVCGEPLS